VVVVLVGGDGGGGSGCGGCDVMTGSGANRG